MTVPTAQQMSFFSDDELLPYHEVYHYAGERWVIEVKRGIDYQGKSHITYHAEGSTTWGFGGPRPDTMPVMEIVAMVKAQIIHGPYEKSRAEMARELQDALRAKGIEA